VGDGQIKGASMGPSSFTGGRRLARLLCLLLLLAAALPPARAGQGGSTGNRPTEAARPAPPTPAEVELVRRATQPLTGAANDYDPLLELVGDARYVLLGEATHGTHEFYRERARISRRLIEEKGFDAVVLESDWPDTYRVNEYVRGKGARREPRAGALELQTLPALDVAQRGVS
jgi:hypothetical protein